MNSIPLTPRSRNPFRPSSPYLILGNSRFRQINTSSRKGKGGGGREAIGSPSPMGLSSWTGSSGLSRALSRLLERDLGPGGRRGAGRVGAVGRRERGRRVSVLGGPGPRRRDRRRVMGGRDRARPLLPLGLSGATRASGRGLRPRRPGPSLPPVLGQRGGREDLFPTQAERIETGGTGTGAGTGRSRGAGSGRAGRRGEEEGRPAGGRGGASDFRTVGKVQGGGGGSNYCSSSRAK